MADPQRLISAYFDGELTDDEFVQFVAWIAADSENTAEFVRASAMHSGLRHILQGEDIRSFLEECPDDASDVLVGTENILSMLDEDAEQSRRRVEERAKEKARKAAAEAEQQQMERLRRPRANRPEPIVIPWSVVYATVGSVAAAIVLFAYSIWPTPDEGQSIGREPASVLIATIDDSVEAEWSDPSVSTAPGTQLFGGKLALTSGIVQLAFEGGAKTVIESPAELELMSGNRARLERGRLVGLVPRRAIGFTIETPSATVVDLGTRFCVEAKTQGMSEAHVIDGMVDVVLGTEKGPADGDAPITRRRLTAGSAVKIDKDGSITDIAFKANEFWREVPRLIQVPKVIPVARDARLVDLDNDGKGDQFDLLDQPRVGAKDYPVLLSDATSQRQVGVGERNNIVSADEDQRRYWLAFAPSDRECSEIPTASSIQLAFTLSEIHNVNGLRVDLYGIRGPNSLSPENESYQAPSTLLVREAFGRHSPVRQQVLLEVTDFAKAQIEQGHKVLVFRLQAEGGSLPNQDTVHNTFVFYTGQEEEKSRTPKLRMTVQRYEGTTRVGVPQP